MTKDRDEVLKHLVDIHYDRNDIDFSRGKFRVKGDTVEVFPASSTNRAIRIEFFGDEIDRLTEIDVLTGEIIGNLRHVSILPASHYATTKEKLKKAINSIQEEFEGWDKKLKDDGKILEAERLKQRTMFDLEMLQEMGYCKGIENYSRHLSGRKPGSAPYTLIDYFPDDYLLFIDESHETIPQVKAMYNGDRSRKDSLVEHGFRLPSSYDNRPLKFNEFEKKINQVVFTSATPGQYEREHSQQVVEQILRPTGLVDPSIEVRPVTGQIDDLVAEINRTAKGGHRVLVTTLTKRMAEDLTDYLKNIGIKVRYMHSDIDALERMEIIRDLRLGKFDVLVGINLLREGLDLPEVELVAILDADKEGFLRSEVSLIQTAGRAARNVRGRVIMYADVITRAMQTTIDETGRRREIQIRYNVENNITPKSIHKGVRDILSMTKVSESEGEYKSGKSKRSRKKPVNKDELKVTVSFLEDQMMAAAKDLKFEKAIELRDKMMDLKKLLAKK